MKHLLSATLLLGFLPIFGAELSLDDAIATALTNNKKHLISLKDVELAKARYKQASSADFPSLDVSALFNRHDEKFIDHTETSFTLPGLGTLPVSYDHTVMGRDTAYAEAKVSYALYAGGKIAALKEQAKEGISYAKEAQKLSDDAIVRDVRKYYAAAELSQKLQALMQRTVDRISTIYKLTDVFYKDGSLKVKKTDYLRTKLMLSTVESMLEEMKTNNTLAKSALNFAMGVSQQKSFTLVEKKRNIVLREDITDYYAKLYAQNRLLAEMQSAELIAKAKTKESQSGYLPSVGVYAKAKTLYNNEKGGIINSTNNDSWDIGVALRYNLFNGGLTKYKVQESRIKELQLEAQKAYLHSAVTLQLQKSYQNLKKSLKKQEILQEAVTTAKENADLNMRAYKHEMVETKDVIEAQIFESITEANYYKSIYDAQASKAELDYLIAKEI